jgi:pimeloyl-ACP methyl ester carboxylesterase
MLVEGGRTVRAEGEEGEDMTSTQQARPAESTISTVIGGDGNRIHVREWGRPDGPEVLMIHGWSGSHQCWTKQVASELADEFRLVALDLRGHGMSDQPLDADQYRQPRLWASDLAAVIDQSHLERPTLVAWSYGGFIVCDYIRAYGQDAVAAIDFVGAAVTLNDRFDHVGAAFLANAPGGANPDLPTRVAALRRFWRAMTEQPLSPEELETGLCGSVSVPPEVLGALISRQINSDDVLRRLRFPVLVTHGRQDQIIESSMAEHVLQVCPTATASWYDGVGHMPFVEDAERFNRELAQLVRAAVR